MALQKGCFVGEEMTILEFFLILEELLKSATLSIYVLTSLAYIAIPKNKGKIKITWDKILTTTYTVT